MSETTNLKLLKHDNVETNTDKFDIENYLNGNWDKIDKNVGEVNTNILNINSKNKEQDTNIEQLQENTETSSNKIAELEKELKEAQEDFYQNSIRGQASGEYIHVEDSSNCRARIGISGNSEQETRSGKNLYKASSIWYKNINGINITVSDRTENSCVLTSSERAYTSFASGQPGGSSEYRTKVEPNTEYTLSINAELLNGTSGIGLYVFFDKDSSSDYFNLKNIDYSKKITFTTPADTNYIHFRIDIFNASTSYKISNIQIEKGSEATSYEPYGVSPSPDYPSEIKTVGSNVNIFDKDNTTFNNKNISVTPTPGNTLQYFNTTKAIQFEVDVAKYVNRSIYFSIDTSTIKHIKFQNLDKDRKFISGIEKLTDFQKLDITSNTKYLNIIIMSENDISNVDNLKLMISLTNVNGTGAYSSYGQGSVKVTKCNKNIFDGKLETGEYDVLGNKISNSGRYRNVNKITIEENETYFFSIDGIGKNYVLFFYDKNGNFLTTGNTDNYKVKTPSHAKYMNFRCFVADYVADYSNLKIQIEKNTIVTSFEQHEEQSYIMPVQQEMLQGDYFDFDNEEEVHKWDKLVLTGDENWQYDSNYKYFKCPSYTFDKIPAGSKKDLGNQKSNYFEITSDWGVGFRDNIDKNLIFGVSDAGYKICIRNTNCTTVEEFKAWLKSLYDAGTPVVIYYKLQTPTRLAFTDEQKAVAKELNNARTYKNVTNITTDSKAILSLDYAKDLETLLNNTQALAVNNASEGV